MEMTIGERRLVARIARRADAEREYQRAKQQGRTASLLEQNRPNVFQMKVANVLPGDRVATDLFYTELLVPEDNDYEFVFPTVVGPRYSNRLSNEAPVSERWIQSPYLHSGEEPPQQGFNLWVEMATSVPIWDLACPSHALEAKFADASRASIRLPETERLAGDRDFILRYRLAGQEVESGLLLYEGPEEKFFLAMVQPPHRVTRKERAPMEYVFVVDVSGSMQGYPLAVSKRLLGNLLNALRPEDRFNVILFSGGSSLLSPNSLPANPAHIRAAVGLIDTQHGGGGTEILPALQRVVDLAPPCEPMGRTVVIATDGYVAVEPEVFDLIATHLGDVNFFAFGIGTSVNRFLIEGMARVGKGHPWVLTAETDAERATDEFLEYVASPVLVGTDLQFEGFDAYDVDPGQLPDLFASRPLVISGKWRGEAVGRIRLRGMSGNGPWAETIDVACSEPRPSYSALRHLWARERIATVSDYGRAFAETPERVEQITDLGLRYGLMTKYTSFVAVDPLSRTKQQSTKVNQPLPLPQGVSDLAVADWSTQAGWAIHFDASSFQAPTEIPPAMEDFPHYSIAACRVAGHIGVPGGVPGGVVGGVPGGLVGGVLGGVAKSAAPPPPPPPVQKLAPIVVSGNVQASRLIRRVEPAYPPLARHAGVQGIVLLRVEVDEKGNVVQIEVVRGHPLLVNAAVEAVKQWKYRPTLVNGGAVPVIVTVTVRFALK